MIRTATGFHDSVYAEGEDCHVVLTQDATYWLHIDPEYKRWVILWAVKGKFAGLGFPDPEELLLVDKHIQEEKKLWQGKDVCLTDLIFVGGKA